MIDKILYRAVLNVNEFYSFRDAFTPMHRKMYSILKLIGVDDVSDDVNDLFIIKYEYKIPFEQDIKFYFHNYIYRIPFEQDVNGKEVSYIKDPIYYISFNQDTSILNMDTSILKPTSLIVFDFKSEITIS